jgi:hypothetical protein
MSTFLVSLVKNSVTCDTRDFFKDELQKCPPTPQPKKKELRILHVTKFPSKETKKVNWRMVVKLDTSKS